jgi:hypothetical protein
MNELIIDEQNIQNKIYTIRSVQVMLDRDLAELYDVQTGRLNEQVKRNIDRFPNDFMFQLSKEEFENWKSQNAMSNSDRMGLRRSPYAFTEQGVSMLSSVLKSKVAVDISVKIIRTFVNMRKMINSNTPMFERFERVEQRLSLHDENFNTLFKALEDKSLIPTQGIFYNGQTFDAYKFVNDLIKSAKKDIKLLDNYIDETVLTLFSKVPNIKVTIYTKTITKQLRLDLEKYNSQYNNIEIKKFENSHDRFLIIDEKEVYHIGASLKDLGKKWFGFSKMDKESFTLLNNLNLEMKER